MFSELEIPSYLGNQIIEAENHLEGLEKASLDLISMTWHAFADNKGNCNYKLDSIQYTYIPEYMVLPRRGVTEVGVGSIFLMVKMKNS